MRSEIWMCRVLSERKGFRHTRRTKANWGKSIRKGWRDNYFIFFCFKCVKAYWLSSNYNLKMLCVLAGTSDSGFETMCYCVEKLAYLLSWLQWCAGSFSQSAYRNQCHVPQNLSFHPNLIFWLKFFCLSVPKKHEKDIVSEALRYIYDKYFVKRCYCCEKKKKVQL